MKNKKYVKFRYELDKPYFDFNELGLFTVNNDDFFDAIEFKDDYITLYYLKDFILQDDCSEEEVIEKAKCILFAIFLECIKKSDAKRLKKMQTSNWNLNGITVCPIECYHSDVDSSSANFELRRADGSIFTEEEHKQINLKNNKAKMKEIIQNSNSMRDINEQDMQKLKKLFTVEDPVIRYFILYSWLGELIGNQNDINDFIEKSKTYAAIPGGSKQFTPREGKHGEKDRTYFTYLRNLMGHSVADVLSINDESIVEKVNIYMDWLIQILLEKLI